VAVVSRGGYYARCGARRRQVSRPANATSREELEVFWARQVDRAVENYRKRGQDSDQAVDFTDLLRRRA
jgi:hypothetical protein